MTTQEIINGASNATTVTSPDFVLSVNSLLGSLPYHLADKIYMVITLVGAFSLISSCMPNPLQKGDNLSKTKLGDRIRQSKWYSILYKIVNILAANVLWAKNFVHPGQRALLDKLLELSMAIKSGASATDSSEDANKLSVGSFSKNGSPILLDRKSNESYILDKKDDQLKAYEPKKKK